MQKGVEAMWHDVDGMGWWMLWGSVMMVLFWGGIIALAVWLVQSPTPRDHGAPHPPSGSARTDDPLGIAKARYARGEISREEFEQMSRATVCRCTSPWKAR